VTESHWVTIPWSTQDVEELLAPIMNGMVCEAPLEALASIAQSNTQAHDTWGNWLFGFQ